jgi:hypothetical protein
MEQPEISPNTEESNVETANEDTNIELVENPFIYTRNIIIHDKQHHLKIWKEYESLRENQSKESNSNKNDTNVLNGGTTFEDSNNEIKNVCDKFGVSSRDLIVMRFAKVIPSNIKELGSIFQKVSPDNEYLKVHEFVIEDKVRIIDFPNIVVFWSDTIHHIKYLIAYLFSVLFENVQHKAYSSASHKNKTLSEYTNTNFGSDSLKKFANSYIFENNERSDIFNKVISVGESDIFIEITTNQYGSINMFYENTFYGDYYKTALMYKNVITNIKKNNIEFNEHLSVSTVTVTLVYNDNEKLLVDIVKMFNMLSTKYYSKIYVQSNFLDMSENNERPHMYIKCNASVNSSNVFKGVNASYNTCSLYMGSMIQPGIIFDRIDVSFINDIRLIFTIADTNLTYKYIISEITKWTNENLPNIINNMSIKECIYDINYDETKYTPLVSGISSTINLHTLSENDLINISILSSSLTNFQIKFQTNTSISMSGAMSDGEHIKETVVKYMLDHDSPTTAILIKDMLPTLHVGISNENNGVITISNAGSVYDTLLMSCLVIALIKRRKQTKVIQESVLDDLSKSNSKNVIQSVRNMGKKYKKNLLKLLIKIDPTLFGTRKVKKYKRAYSVLCQKYKQRPIPITEAEYNIINEELPMSVANLKNQTYNNQRVFLFCPWEKYPFMNYHRFQNQLCIVRCTTKSSNKSQYTFCVNELNAKNNVEIMNKYENQTITLYNPLLTKGRKCKLPEELKYVILQCNLLKLNIQMSIEQYCLETYNKDPFIIKRDETLEIYKILTDYHTAKEYILILQSEINDDYFVFLNETTNKVLTLNDVPYFASFLFRNISKSNAQYLFLNFVSKVIKTNISTLYNESLQYILEYLQSTYNIVYVTHQNIIYGFIYNDIFFMSPRLFWNFSSGTIVERLSDTIKKYKRNAIKLPTITYFDYVKTLYLDYASNLVCVVEVFNVNILIEPIEMSSIKDASNIPRVIMDVESFVNSLEWINTKITNLYDKNIDKSVLVENILSNVMMTMFVNQLEINPNTFRDYIINVINPKLNMISSEKSIIRAIRHGYPNVISWRMSKITTDDIEKFLEMFKQVEYIQFIYDKVINDSTLMPQDNELIHKKIITI